MLVLLALGIIYTLARGMGLRPWPWVLATLVLGLIATVCIYLVTGWTIGGGLIAIPIALVMAVIHREATGRGVMEEFEHQEIEAERKAEAFNRQQYPNDLEILRSYADESFQVPFMKLRNHLHDAGITTYVRQAGITNLMVRESDFERASELAEGYI